MALRRLVLALVFCFTPIAAIAQQTTTFPTTAATVTLADGTQVATATLTANDQAATITDLKNAAVAVIDNAISFDYDGTLIVEATTDGATWTTLQSCLDLQTSAIRITTITGAENGTTVTCTVAGYKAIRTRETNYVAGSVTVTIRAAMGAAAPILTYELKSLQSVSIGQILDVKLRDGFSNKIESSASAPAGTEQALLVRNIPSGNHTVVQPTGSNLHIVCDSGCGSPPATAADDTSNPTATLIQNVPLLFNGSTWDRQHGNWRTTTGDTGAKTVTFNGATQTNYDSRGAFITVLCGTVSGTTPTMTAQLQFSYDAGTTFLNIGPASATVTATGNTINVLVYPTNISQAPGSAPAVLTTGATQTLALNTPLPRTWRLVYTITGTSPSFAITSVSVNYLQ